MLRSGPSWWSAATYEAHFPCKESSTSESPTKERPTREILTEESRMEESLTEEAEGERTDSSEELAAGSEDTEGWEDAVSEQQATEKAVMEESVENEDMDVDEKDEEDNEAEETEQAVKESDPTRSPEDVKPPGGLAEVEAELVDTASRGVLGQVYSTRFAVLLLAGGRRALLHRRRLWAAAGWGAGLRGPAVLPAVLPAVRLLPALVGLRPHMRHISLAREFPSWGISLPREMCLTCESWSMC